MKMKCAHCGNTIGTKNNFCEFCGKSTYKQRERRAITIMFSVFGGVAAVITAITILWSNYLLPWQLPLYKDRKAIIEYVRDNHPESKIAEEHIRYRASGYFFIFELKPDCYITFEEDGFQYEVRASDGEVFHDFYNPAKLTNEVRLFIKENFFDPRGIENVDIFCNFHFNEYDDAVPVQWSEYNDTYTVQLCINEQGRTPQEVGWIYDFYKFWVEKTIFPPSWYFEFIICERPDEADGFLYVSYESDCIDAADLYKRFF